MNALYSADNLPETIHLLLLYRKILLRSGQTDRLTVQEEAPTPNTVGDAEEGMSDAELDKENQASMPSQPILQKSESIVSASANNKLDVIAAKAGGALSAAAVLNLAKGKKKSKKAQISQTDTDTAMASESACAAPKVRCSTDMVLRAVSRGKAVLYMHCILQSIVQKQFNCCCALRCFDICCSEAPLWLQSGQTDMLVLQEEAPTPSSVGVEDVDEGMDDAELEEENQASVPGLPTLQKSESIVSASANNQLDVIAAKAGGALSAAAVFGLAKGKKKSKKDKINTDTTMASASVAPSSSQGAAAAAPSDLKERCGSVKMSDMAAIKDKAHADTQIVSVLDDGDDEEPVDDGKMDPESIEYVTAKRKLDSELLGAKRRLKEVKQGMKRAQNNATRSKVRPSSCSFSSCRHVVCFHAICIPGTGAKLFCM